MSYGFDVACHTCRVKHHLALDGVAGWRFGYASNDSEGHRAIGRFITDHVSPTVEDASKEPDPPHDVRIHWGEEPAVEDFRRVDLACKHRRLDLNRCADCGAELFPAKMPGEP